MSDLPPPNRLHGYVPCDCGEGHDYRDHDGVPNRWHCSLHGFTGRTDDRSLVEHQDAEHGGMAISVMWFRDDEPEVTAQ